MRAATANMSMEDIKLHLYSRFKTIAPLQQLRPSDQDLKCFVCHVMAKVELNVEDMYPTYRQAAFADFVKAVWTNSNELWQGIQQEIRDVGKPVSANVLCVIDDAFVQMPIEVDARVLIQQQPRPPLCSRRMYYQWK